jgi:putative flippase GtrA
MTKTATKIAVLYTFFAVLSTAINIGSQMLSIWIYKGPLSVEISILVGTAMGLPLRYFLEKRYIFNFTSKNLVHDGKLFVFYSAMGVITTLIFWGTEYAFHVIYDTDFMRYLGGILLVFTLSTI